MLFYMLICGVILITLACLAFLKFVVPQRHKDKIKTKLNQALRKFFWNGAIRSVYISYIEICMTCGLQISMLLQGSKYQQLTEKVTGLVMLAYLVSIMIFWTAFIRRNELKFYN